MADFTPGPWKVEREGAERYLRSASGDRSLSLMCDAHYYPWTPDSDEDWNLIAAAPEMYEALSFFLERHIEMVDSGDCGSWNPEKDAEVIKARAALAKAEGKSNG